MQVDVRLRKDAPIKTDTKATLKLRGITGVVFIELDGGSANAKSLLAATPEGRVPEIPSEKSNLSTVLEQLPIVIEKFSSIETQTKKVLTDVGEVTGKIKENPLLSRSKKEAKRGGEKAPLMPNRAIDRRASLRRNTSASAGVKAFTTGVRAACNSF